MQKSIVKKIKYKYWNRTHKYRIRIPKSAKEAFDMDKENGNNVWRDEINKEMPKINDAVVEHDGDVSKFIGYQ